MASGRSEMSHGKTLIKMTITGDEFGPLSVIDNGIHVKTFKDGNYWVTENKDEYLVLYRLYGGPASEYGQFWTPGLQKGGQSFREDHAVARRWNTLDETANLVVPKGVLMYEGIAAPHGNYPGGGLQVFISQSIVTTLHNYPVKRMQRNSESDRRLYQEVKRAAFGTQLAMLDEWMEQRKKRIDKIRSMNPDNLALEGNRFRSLPSAVQRFLRNSTGGRSTASKEVIPQGTYKLHEERVKYMDGSVRTHSLSIRTEFVESTTRTYQSGTTTIVEITHYYNKIYIWS